MDYFVTADDSVSTSSSVSTIPGYFSSVEDGISASSNVSILADFHIQISEVVQLISPLVQHIPVLLTETINTSDSFDIFIKKLATAMEQVSFIEDTNLRVDYLYNFIVEALFVTTLDTMRRGNLTESINLTDDIILSARKLAEAIESALFSTITSTASGFVVYPSESFNIDDTLTSVANLKMALLESFSFIGGLRVDGEDYVVYAMNTKNKAISEFDRYPFTSFSEGLATAADGIYDITGGSDLPFKSSIKTGLFDFKTSLYKQVPYAYLGINGSGNLVLQVTSINRNNDKAEYWYQINESYADTIDTTRAQIGKGIESRYWQFEVLADENANFDLSSFEVLPLVLRRRV